MNKNIALIGAVRLVEQFFGVACPLLAVLSLVHVLGLDVLQWTAALCLWLGCGHSFLHFHDLYPRLKYRPFFEGLFIFGVGLLWPLWYLHSARP